MRAPSLTWWDGSVRNVLLDVAIAAGVGVLGWQHSKTNPAGLLPFGVGTTVAVVVIAVTFAFRRQFPTAMVVLAVAGLVGVGMIGQLAVAAHTMASRRGNVRETWLAAAMLFVTAVIPWGLPFTVDELTSLATTSVAIVVAPTLWGLWIVQRRQLVASLRNRAEQAERERDLRAANAVAEERARIARELHDVVAHRISQIAVLTGALAVSRDGKAAEVAEVIRGTSTTALEEMRELLGVLRRGEPSAPLHPSPSLDSLHHLVNDAVATGQRVHVDLPEKLPEVSGSVGRAVHRLAQEALTNVAKHAPGAEVYISLGVTDTELTVSVNNAPGVPRALRTVPVAESGFGLTGMRERVELAGGRLQAGPRPDGGFTVAASFPGGQR
ncbi:sensor histidine kinase [Lentzea tibetensis]|uniref:histidine kinase n=1 Tax=Lentzea tibetensis TaxID=2591470 RepID=A0A563EFS9_9PSEU|nr:histidine kinase [Lentzea tibetensis]TWP44941.1 sensor histidine kinase [Lentzea tibetensis]